MRVLAFVSLLVVTTGLSVGAGFLLAVQTPRPGEWVLLGSTATALYVIAPIGLGSLLAFWDPNRSRASRSAFRRTIWVVAALQAVAAVLICAYVAVTGAPWWPDRPVHERRFCPHGGSRPHRPSHPGGRDPPRSRPARHTLARSFVGTSVASRSPPSSHSLRRPSASSPSSPRRRRRLLRTAGIRSDLRADGRKFRVLPGHDAIGTPAALPGGRRPR